MEEQFVPYELAVKLKELGFNDECLGWYLNHQLIPVGQQVTNSSNSFRSNKNDWEEYKYDSFKNCCSAPLWQQAFYWFRTEHNLHALNSPVLNQEWTVVIDNTLNAYQVHWDKKPNYEEARLECLRKLIELIENK